MSDNCFSQCNYDHILEQLKEHTTQTLVFAKFNEDFAKQITKQGNYIYCKGPQGDGDIYECLLFGDIASANNGTVNKASGNFYADEGKVSYNLISVLISCYSSPLTGSQSLTLPR